MTLLFGWIDKERVQPADPYEFVRLISTSELDSLRSIRELEQARAATGKTDPPRGTEFIQTGVPLTVDGYYGPVIIPSEENEVRLA